VTVSFNSDSDELARRLNGEAAKAVKYGSVPPADALAFVTINPARQLGIEKRVGSLEPGKDGDFVIWSGDPLSAESLALETWIEGKKYFDRAADLGRRPALEKERAELTEKAKRDSRSGQEVEARRRFREDAGTPPDADDGSDAKRHRADADPAPGASGAHAHGPPDRRSRP
jgi:hypothetical protein